MLPHPPHGTYQHGGATHCADGWWPLGWGLWGWPWGLGLGLGLLLLLDGGWPCRLLIARGLRLGQRLRWLLGRWRLRLGWRGWRGLCHRGLLCFLLISQRLWIKADKDCWQASCPQARTPPTQASPAHLFLFGDAFSTERGHLNGRQRLVIVDATERQGKEQLKIGSPTV